CRGRARPALRSPARRVHEGAERPCAKAEQSGASRRRRGGQEARETEHPGLDGEPARAPGAGGGAGVVAIRGGAPKSPAARPRRQKEGAAAKPKRGGLAEARRRVQEAEREVRAHAREVVQAEREAERAESAAADARRKAQAARERSDEAERALAEAQAALRKA